VTAEKGSSSRISKRREWVFLKYFFDFGGDYEIISCGGVVVALMMMSRRSEDDGSIASIRNYSFSIVFQLINFRGSGGGGAMTEMEGMLWRLVGKQIITQDRRWWSQR